MTHIIKPLAIAMAVAFFLMMAAVVSATLVIMAGTAFSHEWYDRDCCSERDCQPLADDAVTMTDKGYRVKYIGKMGLAVDVVVPFDKVRPSRDGQFHGCASAVKFLCLYAPMGV